MRKLAVIFFLGTGVSLSAWSQEARTPSPSGQETRARPWQRVEEFLLDKSLDFVFLIIVLPVLARILRPAIQEGISAGIEKPLQATLNGIGPSLAAQMPVLSEGISRGVERSLRDVVGQVSAQLPGLFEVWKTRPPIQYVANVIASQAAPGPPPAVRGDLEALLERARIDQDAGRMDAAEQQLKEACNTFGDHLKPWGRLALLYVRQGKKDEAVALLKAVEEKFKEDPAYHSLFGRAYELLGDLHAALPEKQQAVKLDPHSPELRASLAFTLWSLHRVDEAIQEAERGIALAQGKSMAPEHFPALQNSLAYYYAEKGRAEDRERALELIAAALQVKRSPEHLHTAGFVKLKYGATLNEIDAAIADFIEALQAGVTPALTTPLLSEAYQKRNELNQRSTVTGSVGKHIPIS